MRLIDADALLKEYDGAEYEINSSAYAKGCNDVVKWSRKTINEQPTIDAVPTLSQFKRMAIQLGYEPVVRCKECENRNTAKCPMYPKEYGDDFCSCGERRNDD